MRGEVLLHAGVLEGCLAPWHLLSVLGWRNSHLLTLRGWKNVREVGFVLRSYAKHLCSLPGKGLPLEEMVLWL